MPIIAENNYTPRPPLPPGMHIARCYFMVDMGDCTENIPGKGTQIIHKICIGFEFPQLQTMINNQPEIATLRKEFTLSMTKNSKLRPFVEGWRGRAYTDDEAKKFDVAKLVGHSCLINIINGTTKQGKSFDEIGAITPLMNGMQAPPQINPTVLWEWDNPKQEMFSLIPKYIVNKMQNTTQWRKLHGIPEPVAAMPNNVPGYTQNNPYQANNSQGGYIQPAANTGSNQPANNQQGYYQTAPAQTTPGQQAAGFYNPSTNQPPPITDPNINPATGKPWDDDLPF